MNNRTKIRVFTIIGVLLIFVGAAKIIADFNADIQAIRQVIEDSIAEPLKSEGYEVKVKYSFDGYKAHLTLNDADNRFEYASFCGGASIKFIRDFKIKHPEVDAQIAEYHFEFLKPSQSTYTSSSVYYKTAYTAHYTNDPYDPYVYEIKLALNKGESKEQGESKAYLTYLSEWSTHEYDRSDHIVMEGEHYTVQRNDDGSYTIEPRTDADLERNPDSTLMWYMDEYASQYFIFSNVSFQTDSDDGIGNHMNINFSYNVVPNKHWWANNALIVFYIYNQDGKIIGTVESEVINLLEAYDPSEYIVSATFTDEIPSSFRIAFVKYSTLLDDIEYIVFE